jgi:hypothetical protein
MTSTGAGGLAVTGEADAWARIRTRIHALVPELEVQR